MKPIGSGGRSEADNPFVRLIEQGRIRNLDALKRAYRRLVMRTHPDAIGSARLVNEFLEFTEYYEAARAYFESQASTPTAPALKEPLNARLEFFRQLKKLEAIDTPYAYHRDHRQINPVKAVAVQMFREWAPRSIELYIKADQEFDQIKCEKPEGPYLKKALGLNLLPVFHNIIMFHLTGRMVYRQQVRQNLSAIMDRLKKSWHMALADYIEFLVADLENGAAVFQGTNDPGKGDWNAKSRG